MQGKVSRPGYQVEKSFILPDNGTGKRFKIRHVLFEVCWTHGVVCLPDTFLHALSKPLPEGDEQDDATDGENGSGGGVVLLIDVCTFFIRSPWEFRSHSNGSLLHGKLARAGQRHA